MVARRCILWTPPWLDNLIDGLGCVTPGLLGGIERYRFVRLLIASPSLPSLQRKCILMDTTARIV